MGLFLAVLAVSFFRVQVLRSDRYRVQSDENRLRSIPLPAPRGLITDRNGVVLAENVPGYTIGLLASSEDSLMATVERIAPIAGLDSVDGEVIRDRYRRAPLNPVVLLRDVAYEVMAALEERRLVIPGLIVQAEPRRRYPVGEVAGHVVGYVGEITRDELIQSGGRARPGLLVGRQGLEKVYDDRLRGRDGVRYIEVDALGRAVRAEVEGSRVEPIQGDTLVTTIDIELQRYVAESFPLGMKGAVVVMDPTNGDVLSLYSSPSYDPNDFIQGFRTLEWRRLVTSPDRPLFNRAVDGGYPPASPWKLAVAAMALKRGLVTLNTRMPTPCRGGLQYGNRYFRCWYEEGHGDVDLFEAIQHSCDVYFYQLGLRLGLENLLHDGVQMGFDEPTRIDLPSEREPLFPSSTDYFDRRYGPRGWTRAVTLNLAIGQGEHDQTLIKMVQFFASLANPDGGAPRPRLVAEGAGGSLESVTDLPPEDLEGIRAALTSVVEEGTAVGARIAELRIAGKTGTAQNSQGLDHGWFIAFAPVSDPVVVVGALVEHAEHGSSVAPMVNRIIARHLLGPEAVEAPERPFQLPAPSDSVLSPPVTDPRTEPATGG